MNKRALLCALILGALPAAALAAPTVTFEGEVTDQTCKVLINGQTNAVVLLPTVSMKDFGEPLANAQTAGLTPFTVSLTGCTAPTDAAMNISTVFMGYDVDAASGVMGNRAMANAAKGFGIQLTEKSDDKDTGIKLSGITPVAGLTLAVGETEAQHQFGAQYYVLDASQAAAGKITAVAEYTLSYF